MPIHHHRRHLHRRLIAARLRAGPGPELTPEEKRKESRIATAVMILGVVLSVSAALIERHQDFAWEILATWWAQIVAVTICIGIAVGFFFLHRHLPRTYAFIEGCVALTILIAAVRPGGENWERGIKLAGGIYLAVRAMRNWEAAVRDDAELRAEEADQATPPAPGPNTPA